jgi:hypothetical protein
MLTTILVPLNKRLESNHLLVIKRGRVVVSALEEVAEGPEQQRAER